MNLHTFQQSLMIVIPSSVVFKDAVMHLENLEKEKLSQFQTVTVPL